MVELTFLQPQYLWLMFIVPFLILTHFYGLKFSRKKALKFANFEAMSRVTGGRRLSMNIPLLILRFITLVSLVLALAGPIWWYTGEGGNFNFVIAMDVSGSMLVDDFTPDRLTAAKFSAIEFVDTVPKDSKIALMGFSGSQYIKETLNQDFGVIKKGISDLSIEHASGTAVGDAIITSTNLLLGEERDRVVVLLTDGQSNVGSLIEESINYAIKNHVTVNTIGIGTEGGGNFPGLEAVSKLNEDNLKLIAENTGGRFYIATNENELVEAYREIAQSSQKLIPIKLALWFIMITFVALSIEWIIVNTRFRSVP